MNIHHMVVSDPQAASLRYRVGIPAGVLAARGHSVTACSPEYLDWDEIPRPDVLVLHKHYFPSLGAQRVQQAKDQGARVIYDICDNHFASTGKADVYRKMAAMADVITVPTPELQKVIWQYLGREAAVIEDPYEYPAAPPRFDPTSHEGPPRLMWYGHQNNLKALLDVWPELNGFMVYILTDTRAVQSGEIKIIDWSKGAMLAGFQLTDMVVLPVQLHRPRKLSKSANRMVEAIRQGRFVVASPLPAYQQFAEWMWIGNIREGLEWAMSHPDEVRVRIGKAQEYVQNVFDPERITSKWLEVFNEN